MADDWYTGSPQAGLERALKMGGGPLPGTLPPEMSNEYRMAADKLDPLNFDHYDAKGNVKAGAPTTKADVLGGWQAQAKAAQAAQTQATEMDWKSRMAAGMDALRKKKKKPTAQDAGDALAGSSLG